MEKEIKEINAALSEVSGQLKAHAEKADKGIALSAEVKHEVDKLLVEQTELKARLHASEQILANLERGQVNNAKPQTIGEEFAESEGWKGFTANPKGSHRMQVKAAITSGASSAGVLVEPTRVPGIIVPNQMRLTIRDLLNWGRTSSNSIEFVKENVFTNNANVVSENPSAGKPESSLTYELDSAPVATIAHFFHASRQILSDAPMLRSQIDQRGIYGLKLKEEAQLLNGSGTGLNILGLKTAATAYANPGVTVQSETQVDRLRLAALQVELAEFFADGWVLNPIDWTAIELTKDTTHNYVLANPFGMMAPTLWGRPVVATTAMAQGDFLTGAFSQAAQGWDREDVSVMASLEDRDNFIKNMVTVLIEERIGLTIYREDALVTGDFDGLPSA